MRIEVETPLMMKVKIILVASIGSTNSPSILLDIYIVKNAAGINRVNSMNIPISCLGQILNSCLIHHVDIKCMHIHSTPILNGIKRIFQKSLSFFM